MGKTVKGGSTHEKNIELLTKEQKHYLGDFLKHGSRDSKRALRDFLKAPKAPDQMSFNKFKRTFNPSKEAFEDLTGNHQYKKFWNQTEPSRETFEDLMRHSPYKKFWHTLEPSRDTFGNIMGDEATNKYWDTLAPSRNAYENLMQAEASPEAFDKGVVAPMMQQYQQQVLPAIQQRYVDANAGSSSALNQALASSANDLTTQMGSLYLPFMQNQQQTKLSAAQGLGGLVNPFMASKLQSQLGAAEGLGAMVNPFMANQMQSRLGAAQGLGSLINPFMATQVNGRLGAANGLLGLSNPYMGYMAMQNEMYRGAMGNRLAAMQGLTGLATNQHMQPLVSQQSGILGPLIGAGGMLGAAKIMGPAMAASSETVKENIRDYGKGLDVIKNMDVKIYDYKAEVGGAKNRVGVIAEKVPEELQGSIDGIKAVDVYGLVGLLINSVKELHGKIEQLEKELCHKP